MKKIADNSAELSTAISSCNAHRGYMQAKEIPNRVIGTKVTPISATVQLFEELGFPSKCSRAPSPHKVLWAGHGDAHALTHSPSHVPVVC